MSHEHGVSYVEKKQYKQNSCRLLNEVLRKSL